MRTRPEDREALDAYMQAAAVIYTQQLQAAVEEMSLLPLRWREASTLSDYHVRVTAEHAEQLTTTMAPLAIPSFRQFDKPKPNDAEHVPHRVTQEGPSGQ